MTYTELNKMALTELKELNKKVVEVMKLKRSEKSLVSKESLYVGAKVKVDHPRLAGRTMVIEKLNRTKAVVKELNGNGGFRVPFSMITLKS